MEESSLNMAHQQHRRAESHLKYRRFDDAMQCHHNAAELILDALKSTSSSAAMESLSLQYSYHLKQQDIIQFKKEQFNRVVQAVELFLNKAKDQKPDQDAENNSQIQVAIYRTFEEADSLLDILLKPKDDLSGDAKIADAPQTEKIPGVKSLTGKKVKDQKTVIEELQTLNQNLHSLVNQLVLQIEVLKDENGGLKDRVGYLEAERVKYLAVDRPAANSLQVLTDSIEGNSSPFVFSPCSQLSPEIVTDSDRDLPHLAPLEMPKLDFSIFKRNQTLIQGADKINSDMEKLKTDEQL